MKSIIYAYRRKTNTNCPVCSESMYIIYWHNKTRSLMCLKCHFGFNYTD